MQPINRALNVAVNQITGQLFPRGFRVCEDDAPHTFEELCRSFLEEHVGGPRVRIWGGASANTAFACPETNWAFRAWHDWAHVKYSLEFTDQDEDAAVAVQAQQVLRLYGKSDATARMVAQLFAEVTGQGRYKAEHGVFPCDQHGFVGAAIPQYMPAALAFMRTAYSPSDALGFAYAGRVEHDTRFADPVTGYNWPAYGRCA